MYTGILVYYDNLVILVNKSDWLIDLYGMKEMLANDTPFGMNRVALFNLYMEFAFVGFVVLMALLLSDLWEKHHD